MYFGTWLLYAWNRWKNSDALSINTTSSNRAFNIYASLVHANSINTFCERVTKNSCAERNASSSITFLSFWALSVGWAFCDWNADTINAMVSYSTKWTKPRYTFSIEANLIDITLTIRSTAYWNTLSINTFPTWFTQNSCTSFYTLSIHTDRVERTDYGTISNDNVSWAVWYGWNTIFWSRIANKNDEKQKYVHFHFCW